MTSATISPALGDQRADQPLEKVGLDRGQIGPDCRQVGLGREIAVQQGDMLVGEGLGLPLGKAVIRQPLDEAMGVGMRWPRTWRNQ